MKNQRPQVRDRNIEFNSNKRRAENKDDLDSREGEEQLIKGNTVTHNRKSRKSRKKSENSKDEKGRH